jgi:hypothetical protein
MKSTRPLPRLKRLTLVLESMNRIHCRRRLLGRRTDHLHARCKVLTAAWLDARAEQLS